MKRVIMTVGPQYAGKSTFCEKVRETHPGLTLVSRDAILFELYGTVWIDAYFGGHFAAWDKVWETVSEHLKQPNITVLLDAWSGPRADREDMQYKLRAAGANRIDAWYFTTPFEKCLEWSFLRDPIKVTKEEWRKIKEQNRADEYRSCYETFHSQNIGSESGFDSITKINVLQPPSIEYILAL